MAETKHLAEKIASIMGRCSRVPKNGRNQFHGYDYATEGDVADTVREACAAEGVAILPSVQEVVLTASKTVKGADQTICQVKVCYKITDGAETIESIFVGMAADNAPGDKAIYKALTGCHKYFMLKTFSISTGEDEDPERDAGAPPRKPDAKPARPPAPKAEHPAPEKPPPATPEELKQRAADTVKKARLASIFGKVQKAIETKDPERVRQWVKAVLKHDKPSAEWDDSDFAAVEEALA